MAIGFFRVTAKAHDGGILEACDFIDGGEVNTTDDAIGIPMHEGLGSGLHHWIHEDDPAFAASDVVTDSSRQGAVKGHVGL